MTNLRVLGSGLPRLQRRLTGGERLMLALIGTLVDDLRDGSSRRRIEVRHYLAGVGASEPFGFASICSHFGWSEGHVRRGLAKIAARPPGQRRWRSFAG